MQRIFIITGIGGHLGNTIARKLLQNGETVRGFARPTEDVTMRLQFAFFPIVALYEPIATLSLRNLNVISKSAGMIRKYAILSIKNRKEPGKAA